jgi:hypothetical protein
MFLDAVASSARKRLAFDVDNERTDFINAEENKH